MRPFRVQNAVEQKPAPAALPASDQRPELPFALARDDDYVVRVVAGSLACTGTLIEEDQVLTAHHCVSERNEFGEFIDRDLPARKVRVELGGDNMPWGEVGVRAVIAPPCGHSAGAGDIAVLVLERKLIGVATVRPRLDHPPEMGERVAPVGFGRCALGSDAIYRHQRAGGRIDKMLDMRFRLSASICPGDSGGPALSSKSGEVVGVISQAVMDGSESTTDRAEFTRLDRWRSVFAMAKSVSEGTSLSELPPLDGCPAK
jgi:Trypsin